MSLSDRDRRALAGLAVALVGMGALYFWPQPAVEVVGGGSGTVESAAARLDRVRQEAALGAGREQLLTAARAELAELEKGLIPADSAPQAQAQLLQIFRRVARAQSPPLDVRQTNFGAVRPYGDGYAQVQLTISAECQIEQLVNLMADLAGQPELVAVEELHVTATANKQKSLAVQMAVAGLTRGALARTVGSGTGAGL